MSAERAFARRFAASHPDEVARTLERFAPDDVSDFIAELPIEVAGRVLAQMSRPLAAAVLGRLDGERAAQCLMGVPPGVAAPLIAAIPLERRDDLLRGIESGRREPLERLLTHAAGTVGSIVDPDVLTLRGDTPAPEAVEAIRLRAGDLHHLVHVLDGGGHLLGVAHVRDLMRAEESQTLRDLMVTTSDHLSTTTRLAGLEEHPAWQRRDSLPVLDHDGVLLGIVRHRQLRVHQTTHGSGPLVSTLIGLGELYWAGLSSLMPAVPAQVGPPTPSPQEVSNAD